MTSPMLARLIALCLVTGSVSAHAVTLTRVSESTPCPGVTMRQYRTASPATNAWVVLVDLCAAGIHVDATRATTTLQTAQTYASARGVQLATNGDFYASGPTRVYGQAVGDGVGWPSSMTGFDPAYASSWYYQRAGWFAFGWDGVEFTHTRQVKQHPDGRTLGGWEPTRVTGTYPPDTLALVSGFPELVTEGQQVTCTSPTATTCFPDRSDMRARNPRTAMGLTADRKTFILLVVDGRTTASAGMYGTELAETMKKLGAWQAFNLDGGGSTQLWRRGAGYVNDAPGNGGTTTVRAVLNHWGLFAGTGTGKPSRPGHCATSPSCGVIPATGGTVDETSPCFGLYGPLTTWRQANAGQGGSLRWTNAMSTSAPDNWAWWQLDFAAAGDYRVEYYAAAGYAQFTAARYEILANGQKRVVTSNQASATGWRALGTFRFAAGGGQYVRLYDNNPSATVPAGTHLAADAIRLVPASPICGDGTCDSAESCTTCLMDCGPCPTCGDGTCAGAETCATCTADCGACCGNGVCQATETCQDCALDCGACPTCGDGTCNGLERCSSCALDCGACCGDGTCDETETCSTCADDCGACARCGDGVCGGDETCDACASDCGACDGGAGDAGPDEPGGDGGWSANPPPPMGCGCGAVGADAGFGLVVLLCGLRRAHRGDGGRGPRRRGALEGRPRRV